MNKRRIGSEWEERAAAYLEAGGVRIKERNYRCRQGEVDIIGLHKGYLVFVEVKYRAGIKRGYAVEAVDYRKQCRICRVADYYRCVHASARGLGVRYDVVAIQQDEILWFQNAFGHIYQRGVQGW